MKKKLSKRAKLAITQISIGFSLLTAVAASAFLFNKIVDENEELKLELDRANLLISDFMGFDSEASTVTHF